jgi:hypothetical protein
VYYVGIDRINNTFDGLFSRTNCSKLGLLTIVLDFLLF